MNHNRDRDGIRDVQDDRILAGQTVGGRLHNA
jgi:hypothetical protein